VKWRKIDLEGRRDRYLTPSHALTGVDWNRVKESNRRVKEYGSKLELRNQTGQKRGSSVILEKSDQIQPCKLFSAHTSGIKNGLVPLQLH
jgi:hypothetical protein